MIRTVLGDIPTGALGVTMCHEHLAMDLARVRGDDDSTFDDRELMEQELAGLRALGAQAVVEVSTIDMGRDAKALKALSQASGLHVVAATGFYLAAYHPDWLREASAGQVADLFCRELTAGMEDTGIRAGVIGEVATGREGMAPTERTVLCAAARAAAETGCAVITHCDLGALALEQTELLRGEGMDTAKLVLSHLDLLNDNDYHRRALDTGANLAFDTVGKTTYLPDEQRADALVRLLQQGYEDQLMLSQDVSRKSYLAANGRRGYTAVLGHFVPMLQERGVSGEQLEKLLVKNPARILDME